jgi:TP901 family phage tail tape measure protein
MALSGEVANLIVALKLDDRGFSGKLNAAARQLRQMDSGLSQMGRGAGQVAGGLARLGERAAIAAAGGLAAVVTTAASFEQAFTGVEKTVDGTDAQLAELEQTVREMARTMPLAFEDLAAIGEAGGALGIARESLDEFIDVVARLSVSTNLSSDEAATALGQLTNVLHLSGDELEQFADSLVALGNAGASTEDQIVEMAARFGAAGNSAGLTKEEILALSSAVASMGIEVEAGGSSLSRLFNSVATNIGTANEKAQAFAGALGISLEEFRKSWEQDALGTFEELLGVLNQLDQFEAAALLKEIGVTNTRDVNTLRLMAQNTEFLGEQLRVAENATGALREESDKFFNTTAGQWELLKNNVRDAAATLGTDLLPVVNEVMAEFVGFLNQPGTQSGLKEFAKDLADGVRGLMGELKGTDFSGIIAGIRLTAEVAKGAFAAFTALPAPIQQLAIAALVANRVTGGAIGQIAAGLGNLVLGSLKTITAANVTVIGGNVTGGPGMPGGAGGGGIGGTLGRIGATVAAGATVGYAAVTVANFEEYRQESRNYLQGILDELPRTPEQIEQSMLDINAELTKQRPFLEGILFHTNVRPQLEEQLRELERVKDAQERGVAAARDAIPWAIRNANETRALNESEGRRFGLLFTKQDALAGLSRSANAYGARTAAATEATSRKNFSPNLNVKTNVFTTVKVSTTIVKQQVDSVTSTIGGQGGQTFL